MSQHILFVDDEAPIRELLSVYFRKKGYRVTAAITADEAMSLVEASGFDLAILDINLAGDDGLELLCALKAKHPRLPILMFTSLGYDQPLLQEALDKGASGYLSKTESLDKLLGEAQQAILAAQSAD